MTKLNYKIGDKVNMLTVVDIVKINNRSYYLCQCECTNTKPIRSDSLGKTKSCGCLSKKTQFKKEHGKTGHRLHNIWLGMKERCYNKNNKSYINYGSRGIVICEEWLDDFMNFYNWSMNNGYKDKLTIDRIDNDKGYSPNNCRWTTTLVQQNNTRQTHKIEINGEIRSISEWSRISGVKRDTILRRLQNGLIGDKLIEKTYNKAEKQSGIKWIKWDKQKQRWKSEHRENRKIIHIGYFKDLEDAIKAREKYLNNLNNIGNGNKAI